MPWTPAEVIDEARDYHPSFDELQTPNKVARRFVDRYDEELWQKVKKEEPDWFLTTETIAMPIDPWDDGYVLPDWTEHRGGTVVFEGGRKREAELNIVPFRNRFHPGARYPAYIVGDTLHFIGSEQDWNNVDRVLFHYIAARTPLDSPTAQSDLPDQVKPAVVERLVLFMAQRGAGGDGAQPVPVDLSMQDWRETERLALETVATSHRADTTYIRDVWG